jgi:Transglycosylase
LLKKEDTLKRKLLEAVLAIRIFARLTRTEILTRYMNVVPHARNMYGFDDPAHYYFGVGVQDLTLPEAALLVGMLPEPKPPSLPELLSNSVAWISMQTDGEHFESPNSLTLRDESGAKQDASDLEFDAILVRKLHNGRGWRQNPFL